MAGFVKLWRSDEFLQLVKDHQAFVLAAIIAVRARRTDGLDLHGLAVGEALLGDYREYGMTEGQYREAKKRLANMGFATFRTTNRGTVASLLFTGVFDPNLETEQRAAQQTSNEPHNGQTTSRTTTNKDRREKINEKNNYPPSPKGEKLLSILDQTELSLQRREALALWLQYKKEKGQSYKPTGLKTLIKQWAGSSDEDFCNAVESSIAQNYTGLFAPNKPLDHKARSLPPGKQTWEEC